MEYEALRTFAATWGLVGLVVLFLTTVVYALLPRNRNRFEEASKIPLEED